MFPERILISDFVQAELGKANIGLRGDEIRRLRVGCVRRHQENEFSICLLDVPVNKTAAFTKPVDRVVGEAINAWEKVRPVQAKLSGRK